MSCPVCHTSPCLCGDNYYKLTDEGFLAHLSHIQAIAKDRGLDAKVMIGDINVDDYITMKEIGISFDVSLINMLTSFITVPEYYKKRLEQHKGQSAIAFFDNLKEDFDFIGFPLIVAMLAAVKENHRALRKGLILNFYDIIVKVGYELNPPTVPYDIDDFFMYSNNTDEFNRCVYLQRNAYATLCRNAKDKAGAIEPIIRGYDTGMKCIENILRMEGSLINHSVEFLCATHPDGEKLYADYINKGNITNQLRDELQSANYAFCREYSNVLVGDLKV